MRKAALALLPPGEIDPFTGEEDSPIRDEVRKELAKTDEQRTDLEAILRSTDAYWFLSLCLSDLHRLPSEVLPIIGCREYTRLQAFAIVKTCYERLAQRELKRGGSKPE